MTKNMKKFMTAVIVLSAVFFSVTVSPAGEKGHILMTPKEIIWVEGPASLPGSKMAVLEGDPNSTGLVTMRLKLPANSVLAPHTHGGDERVTVISGTLYFGVGEKMDRAKAKALPAGSFFVMPVGTRMFAFTKDKETVIQLNVMGPWTMTYIHPTDDLGKK